MSTISTVIFALLCVLAASACDGPEDPAVLADTELLAAAPAGFFIEEITTNGKGCPSSESVEILMSANKTLMRVIYDEMVLGQSPGQTVQTTHCTTVIQLKIPSGWKVAPRSLRTRGYAYLDANIEARRYSNLFLAGMPVGVEFDTIFEGPHDHAYDAMEVVPAGAGAWSSCGGSATFSISNSLVLDATANPDGDALLTLDDQRLVAWQFKKC